MNLLNFLIPSGKPLCIICRERHLKADSHYISGKLCICSDCLNSIDRFSSPAAFKCEKNLKSHIAAYPYTGVLRTAYARYKFYGEWAYADIFSQLLEECLEHFYSPGDFDMLLPVPLSQKRITERGFNQSAKMVRGIAEKFGMEYSEDSLFRIRHTKRQSGLDAKSRVSNVRGAFLADPQKVAGKSILLADDIFTLGATMRECADTLINAGAASVVGLTLFCVTPPEKNDNPPKISPSF